MLQWTVIANFFYNIILKTTGLTIISKSFRKTRAKIVHRIPLKTKSCILLFLGLKLDPSTWVVPSFLLNYSDITILLVFSAPLTIVLSSKGATC